MFIFLGIMEITLSKYKAKDENIESEAKCELKGMILDRGIIWGKNFADKKESYRWILDTKDFLLDAKGSYLTAELFLNKIRKYNADFIGGCTLASHLITSSVVYLSSLKAERRPYAGFLIRRQAKDYGLQKSIEGKLEPNSSVIIIDDGLNAGGYSKLSIEAVEKLGCKAECVVVLVNFHNSEFEELKGRGYKIEAIFSSDELGLHSAQDSLNPNMFVPTWTYGAINNSDYSAPKSSPAVTDNGIYIGSDQNKIIALDFSGKLKWEFITDYHEKGVHSSPASFEGKIICGSYSGNLYALN